MSTDESDQEDSLDVNTDEEENVPVSITRKPWIRRQPLYRESMVCGFFILSPSTYTCLD